LIDSSLNKDLLKTLKKGIQKNINDLNFKSIFTFITPMQKDYLNLIFQNYFFFFNLKNFLNSEEGDLKYFCKLVSNNVDQIKFFVLETFQKKIIKFLIKKEFKMIEKMKILEKEKAWKNKIIPDKIKFNIKKEREKIFPHFQKNSFMPWSNPINWSSTSNLKKEEIKLEKSQRTSVENEMPNRSLLENFEIKASQKISKKKIKKETIYIKKIPTLPSRNIKKAILLPYFNICLDKIKILLGTKKFDKKKYLETKIKDRKKALLTSEGINQLETNKHNSLDYSLSYEKLRKKNFPKKSLKLFGRKIYELKKNNIFFFSNLSPFLEKIKKKKNVKLVVKLLNFLQDISKKSFSLQQLNPRGEVLGFFLEAK
jgi:hypothetical protein